MGKGNKPPKNDRANKKPKKKAAVKAAASGSIYPMSM